MPLSLADVGMLSVFIDSQLSDLGYCESELQRSLPLSEGNLNLADSWNCSVAVDLLLSLEKHE